MRLLTRKEEYVEKEKLSNALGIEISKKQRVLNNLNDLPEVLEKKALELNNKELALKEKEAMLITKERDLDERYDAIESLSDELHGKIFEADKRLVRVKADEYSLRLALELFDKQSSEFKKHTDTVNKNLEEKFNKK